MENITENTGEFHLPEWDELPDIELYNDQVITLMNKYMGALFEANDPPLTPSMINNYVKHGILPCPVKKKYSRPHIARLIMICAMKPVLSIQSIDILIKALLENSTEEEMLNSFVSNFCSAFMKTSEILDGSFKELTASGTSVMPQAVIRAAAMSAGSKKTAEKALSELRSDGGAEK